MNPKYVVKRMTIFGYLSHFPSPFLLLWIKFWCNISCFMNKNGKKIRIVMFHFLVFPQILTLGLFPSLYLFALGVPKNLTLPVFLHPNPMVYVAQSLPWDLSSHQCRFMILMRIAPYFSHQVLNQILYFFGHNICTAIIWLVFKRIYILTILRIIFPSNYWYTNLCMLALKYQFQGNPKVTHFNPRFKPKFYV